MSAEREVLLTLTDSQHAELAKNLARIRMRTGARSNTAAILDAVRQKAETKPSTKRKAAA